MKILDVVLLVFAVQYEKRETYSLPMYSQFTTVLRQIKPNITKKGAAHHYKSIGYYYYFGNKGAYKTICNTLVGPCTNKGSRLAMKTEILMHPHQILETCVYYILMN